MPLKIECPYKQKIYDMWEQVCKECDLFLMCNMPEADYSRGVEDGPFNTDNQEENDDDQDNRNCDSPAI